MLFRGFVISWMVHVGFVGIASAQQTHLLVITGVAGDDEHAQKFQKWATAFIDAAKKKEGIGDSQITYLSDKKATKDGVEKAFADIAARAKSNDQLFVLLIGHGSFDGRVAAFNLMGPDLTAADYAKLLAKFPTQRVVFVNTASSSGAFLSAVAGPGRVVVTATKTGGERNDTDFPEHFVEAYNDPAADRDRNGHVSVAEAFEYAKAKVVQAFQQKGLILTEHAVLDDSGEGKFASTVFLGTGRADALDVDMSDPAMKALVEERNAIQRDIDALRAKKASMDEAAYETQLEALVTKLALKTREIREKAKK